MTVKTLRSPIAIAPAFEGLEEARKLFMEFLDSVELQDAAQQDWKLAFTEVVANAVNHSRAKEQASSLMLSWGYNPKQKQIWLEVEDPGPGPKQGLIEVPQLPVRPTETSGRGLYIINKFADSWSHVRCRKYYRQRIARFTAS